MIEVREHPVFTKWLTKLRDGGGRVRILRRLARIGREGHFGDVKYFDGIDELRIDYGPGYRVYFVRRGDTIVILLCGGDKGQPEPGYSTGHHDGEGGLTWPLKPSFSTHPNIWTQRKRKTNCFPS